MMRRFLLGCRREIQLQLPGYLSRCLPVVLPSQKKIGNLPYTVNGWLSKTAHHPMGLASFLVQLMHHLSTPRLMNFKLLLGALLHALQLVSGPLWLHALLRIPKLYIMYMELLLPFAHLRLSTRPPRSIARPVQRFPVARPATDLYYPIHTIMPRDARMRTYLVTVILVREHSQTWESLLIPSRQKTIQTIQCLRIGIWFSPASLKEHQLMLMAIITDTSMENSGLLPTMRMSGNAHVPPASQSTIHVLTLDHTTGAPKTQPGHITMIIPSSHHTTPLPS